MWTILVGASRPTHTDEVDGRRETEPRQWLCEVQKRTRGPVRVRLSPEVLVDFPVEVYVGPIPGFGYVTPHMLGIGHALEVDIDAVAALVAGACRLRRQRRR
jgi:hypothetical protein